MIRQRNKKPRRITDALILRRREQLTREIGEAICSIIGKYDLAEIELKGKLRNERTLLDTFIDEYKVQTDYQRSLGSVHRMRGE